MAKDKSRGKDKGKAKAKKKAQTKAKTASVLHAPVRMQNLLTTPKPAEGGTAASTAPGATPLGPGDVARHQ